MSAADRDLEAEIVEEILRITIDPIAEGKTESEASDALFVHAVALGLAYDATLACATPVGRHAVEEAVKALRERLVADGVLDVVDQPAPTARA